MIYRQTFILTTAPAKSPSSPRRDPCSMSSAAKNNATPVVLKGADKQRVIKKINRYSTNFSRSLPCPERPPEPAGRSFAGL